MDGQVSAQSFRQDPDAITKWLGQLRDRFPGRPLCVAIEQSRGALIYALQGTPELEIYPLNPKQAARYRQALYPTGAKSDGVDAELLARFLLHHRDKLRPQTLDDDRTRQLEYLVQMRRGFVDQRTSLVLKLEAMLKLYFPLPLTLFGGRGLTSDFMVALLGRWASLPELRAPHPQALRDFFRKHGVKDEDRQTAWIEAIRSATPLTQDKVIIQTHALCVKAIVRQIDELNKIVSEFEGQLRTVVAHHPDEPIFRSFPGAGDALVPRLIVGFGANHDRYQSAKEIQSYSGTAPITVRSGKSCHVQQRFACPKFLKQTFDEFADQARRWSSWSRAYYDLKRSQGMRHRAAVRALDYKWIRIMYRLSKTRTTYSEKDYIQHLRLKPSPVVAFLENV